MLVAEKAEWSNEEAAVVAAQLKRWSRRGLLVVIGGLVLLSTCIVAAVLVESRADPLARDGKKYTGTIDAVEDVDQSAKLVKVKFGRDGWNQVAIVKVVDPIGVLDPGAKVQLLVDRKTPSRVSIKGATKPSKVLSVPVAALFALSVLVLGVGTLDFLAATRIRRHLRGNRWTRWRWEGVVHAPGRGRVRVAGVLTHPATHEQFLVVNSPGSWREGLEALAEPAEISLAGRPPGLVVARHPTTLRPVLLRAPRNNRTQADAFRLLNLEPP